MWSSPPSPQMTSSPAVPSRSSSAVVPTIVQPSPGGPTRGGGGGDPGGGGGGAGAGSTGGVEGGGSTGVGGSPSRSKTARKTFGFVFIQTKHFGPTAQSQAPPQPVKTEPGAGVAVRTTSTPNSVPTV